MKVKPQSVVKICVAMVMASLARQVVMLQDVLKIKPPQHSTTAEENPLFDITKKNRRRKFVKYISSAWEQSWLDNIQKLESKEMMCNMIKNNKQQRQWVHDFLNLTCTTWYDPPYDNWCIIDDTHHPMWYDRNSRDNFRFEWSSESAVPSNATIREGGPKPVIPIPPPGRALDEQEDLLSKFIFMDEKDEEYVEYIEPLVYRLRFPLAGCQPWRSRQELLQYTEFRGYIIPLPKGDRFGRKLYFDAGASSWSNGFGGPSLRYFHEIWLRHGIQFDGMYAFEKSTSPKDFYETVPEDMRSKVHYQQCTVSSNAMNDTEETPFIPLLMKKMANRSDDYVVFKLDIDTPLVEDGSIHHIIGDPGNCNVDEVFWEHHVISSGPFIYESYKLFLRMRKKGIRAHSWV